MHCSAGVLDNIVFHFSIFHSLTGGCYSELLFVYLNMLDCQNDELTVCESRFSSY